MNRIRSLIIPFFLLGAITSVKAETCDNNYKQYLKELSSRINYQSNYVGAIGGDTDYQTYEIYFENLGADFYITDYNNNIYFGKDGDKNYVESGQNNFKIYSSKCNMLVDIITVDLLKFNEQSLNSLCDGLDNKLDVCSEWYQGNVSDSLLKKKVDEYDEIHVIKEENIFAHILDYIISSYYIFIPLFLGVILVVIFLVIRHRNRNVLD